MGNQPFGWTPLTSALFKKHQQLVMMLLNNPDTDVDVANSSGMTPLHMACDQENLPAIHNIRKAKSGNMQKKAPTPATVCPSCMSPLCSQMTVFQCSMGHLTCSQCRDSVKRCTECW